MNKMKNENKIEKIITSLLLLTTVTRLPFIQNESAK
jgi:hypothetical protein